MFMRCFNCNSVLEKDWKFCASCGANICGLPDNMAKAIEASILSALSGTNMSGFAIRVIPSKVSETDACEKKTFFKRQPQTNFLETPNKPLKVVEPKTDITRLPGRIIVDAELPEVSNGNDIKVMLLGESIEIRAVAPEKMYMKILRIPKNMRLARSSFIEGKLRMELGEGVRIIDHKNQFFERT